MSCPHFAKEVSYLVRAPIYSPPVFLISKYQTQTTWSRQPPVARLQLVESIFSLVFVFLFGWFFICEPPIWVSSLLQHHSALGPTKWSWRSLIIWTQRERAVLCFKCLKSRVLQRQSSDVRQVSGCCLCSAEATPTGFFSLAPVHW